MRSATGARLTLTRIIGRWRTRSGGRRSPRRGPNRGYHCPRRGPCTQFQDQEQISVYLARRSNEVCPFRFGSRYFAISSVRQTKKAGAWPACADCSSEVSRLTFIRRAVPWIKAHWAFEIYVRRRHFEPRLACACRAQLAVRAADSLLGLYAVVLGLLLLCYELSVLQRPLGRHETNSRSYEVDS